MATDRTETGARDGSSGEWGLPNTVPGVGLSLHSGLSMYRRADRTGDESTAVVHRRRVTHDIRMTVAPTTQER